MSEVVLSNLSMLTNHKLGPAPDGQEAAHKYTQTWHQYKPVAYTRGAPSEWTTPSAADEQWNATDPLSYSEKQTV